uniref:Uncharacterized protein n=1 Tax=Anguilla anguilla TaxID=7936 RepID=A0A0E9TGJ2_ANGAN
MPLCPPPPSSAASTTSSRSGRLKLNGNKMEAMLIGRYRTHTV